MKHDIRTKAFQWGLRQPRRLRLHWSLHRLLRKVNRELARGELSFDNLRNRTLQYVDANRRSDLGPGAYSFQIAGQPLLYASAYAALTRHLYGDLQTLSASDRLEWIAYIQKHQSDDGLFRDPAIACEKAETMDWWGWRHMTLHVLMALAALGGTASKPFRVVDRFRRRGHMAQWLETRDWRTSAVFVSNEVQNFGTILQYVRDFQGETWCDDALNEMYNWLDGHQDARTGYWGYGEATPYERSQGVQTGYHLWCLYFYDKRPVQHAERIIDSCLATQNRIGGYGVTFNSSACEDIDSIDPLVRLCFESDYRRDDILASLEKAMAWVLVNRNASDGGWVFRRHQAYDIPPHEAMCVAKDESSMAYTWFRTLSLAYLARALPDSPIATRHWHFDLFPGLQFWPESFP